MLLGVHKQNCSISTCLVCANGKNQGGMNLNTTNPYTSVRISEVDFVVPTSIVTVLVLFVLWVPSWQYICSVLLTICLQYVYNIFTKHSQMLSAIQMSVPTVVRAHCIYYWIWQGVGYCTQVCLKYIFFLHDWSWISPWINSISNEFTIHLIASQLSVPCDVISDRLWRHQQYKASKTRSRCVRIVFFLFHEHDERIYVV